VTFFSVQDGWNCVHAPALLKVYLITPCLVLGLKSPFVGLVKLPSFDLVAYIKIKV
jgi:hypothetical protein